MVRFSELAAATRVKFHKGAVYKDKGSSQYGADSDAAIASTSAQSSLR